MASAAQASVSWSCLRMSCGWLRPPRHFGGQGLGIEGAAFFRSAVPLGVVVGREACSQWRSALVVAEVAMLVRHRHLSRGFPVHIFGGWLQSPPPTSGLQPTATTVNRTVGVLRSAVLDTSGRSCWIGRCRLAASNAVRSTSILVRPRWLESSLNVIGSETMFAR